MNPLEAFHAFSDSNRNRVFQLAGLMSLAIAITDWKIAPNISMGFLYIVPMLLISGSLKSWQIVGASRHLALCARLSISSTGNRAAAPGYWY